MPGTALPLVGVDIGGTKTHVLIADQDAPERDLVFPTASWRPIEQHRDGRRLAEIINTHQPLDNSVVLAVGAHGCDSREQCAEFAADLQQYVRGPVVVVNDAELLVPAAGLDEGIGVVVGTGSIVVGHDATGGLLTGGGWGWILGDPGSAPGLVRDAARAVLAGRDAGRSPGILADQLMAAFRVDNLLELAYTLTAAREITDWSTYAHVVFDAADAGSRLAAGVIDDSARTLATTVTQLVERGARGRCVVAAGGVITARDRLSSALADHLADLAPQLDFRLLEVPPVHGALELARRTLHQRGAESAQPAREPQPARTPHKEARP